MEATVDYSVAKVITPFKIHALFIALLLPSQLTNVLNVLKKKNPLAGGQRFLLATSTKRFYCWMLTCR